MHGTWVSGQRIPTNTPVELAVGDVLQLGGSKREYRLHWLSLHEALEMDDLLPPLIEEDKEEFCAHQEASKELVPAQTEPMDMENHQETGHQVVSEQIEYPPKVIPSAPPLPGFAHSFYLEESSLTQFDENRERVIEELMFSDNSVTQSVCSSIIPSLPATIANAGTTVQSDKQDASGTISRRAKLKSVKSLRIYTGRKNSTLSNSYQKEAQNENLLCSQNCGKGCAACMVLFDNSDVKEAEEKENMFAPEKEHMNSHVLDNITMEENQVPNPLKSEHLDKENSMLSFVKETNQHGIFSENSVPQGSVDAKLQMRSEPMNYVSALLFKDEIFAGKGPQLDVRLESHEHVSENSFTQDRVDGNTNKHKDMKHDGFSHLKLDGSIPNKDKMAQNKIAVCPQDCDLEGIIYDSLFDNLDIKGTEENEQSNLLDKENTTPLVSGNIIMERSQLLLKPNRSQELLDSISPLSLEHDTFSDSENSMLNIGKQMKSNELISENVIPSISVETEFMPMSHLDFENDIIPYNENSVLGSGKYDAAISPVRQGDLFPDENVTPASRGRKPIAGKALGSRMDSLVLAEYTSNISVHKRECGELSSEYDAISPVRQGDISSDKENVTPASRGLKSIGRRVLGSRMDSSMSAEYPPNRSVNKQECNGLSSKSKGFHTVDDEAFYSDKENLTPMSTGGMKARRCLPKNLFPVDVDQDQEVFYSDKENSTPVSSVAQKTRDTPMSENRARIESVITKKRVVERFPFQTLVSNSPSRPNARAADVSFRLEDELNSLPHKNQESDSIGEGMKVWTMVADTYCVLDDESRKSIMLLRGIKGTHLIIPRIVIRELDCMKQREGLFRRSSKATSILQWIEDCMENESWWIHVQSSSEMSPVAPTPPATPTEMQRNDEGREAAAAGTFNPMFALFSPRSFTDIVTPRTEDRVLDCALLFQKLRGSQKNMVILSNSVALKIKAMAEGLLCEGAKEFRETLMNPCSGRFMWAASAPRGAAWLRLDEAALAENYYNSHHHHGSRRTPTPRPVESARGLKLILLHNSSSLHPHNGGRREE